MTEIDTPTSFVVIRRTKGRGGCENRCFTPYVQDNGGRYCLRGPMVQSDAEWRENNTNSATESEMLFGRSSGLRAFVSTQRRARDRVYVEVSTVSARSTAVPGRRCRSLHSGAQSRGRSLWQVRSFQGFLCWCEHVLVSDDCERFRSCVVGCPVRECSAESPKTTSPKDSRKTAP